MQQDDCAFAHTTRHKLLVRARVCKGSNEAQNVHFRIAHIRIHYPDLFLVRCSKKFEATDLRCQSTFPLAVFHFTRVNYGLKQACSFELTVNTDGIVGEKGYKPVLGATMNDLFNYLSWRWRVQGALLVVN